MVDSSVTSFSYWKEKTKGEIRLDSPFDFEALSSDSIFLWTEMSAPMPCGSTGGDWAHCTDPTAAIGFLRHVVLPTFFGIWLVRDDWDAEPNRLIPAEDLLKKAANSQSCEYKDDIVTMRQIIARLDDYDPNSNRGMIRVLRQVEELFNRRWERTPTWWFRIDIFESPSAVGEALLRRIDDEDDEDAIEDRLGMSKEEWQLVCENALKDQIARSRFAAVVKESYVA